jgi:hypothetical protein
MHFSVFRNNLRFESIDWEILRGIWKEYFLDLYKDCFLSLDVVSTAGLCLSCANRQFSLVLVQFDIFKLLRLDFCDRRYSPSQNRPPGVDRYWKEHENALFILFVLYFFSFQNFFCGWYCLKQGTTHSPTSHSLLFASYYSVQYWTWKHEYISGS